MSTDHSSLNEASGTPSIGTFPQGEALQRTIARRRRRGTIWRWLFASSLVIGIVALATLVTTVVDSAFGYVVVQYKVDPATLAGGRPLEELSKDELVALLRQHISRGLFRRFERERPFAERTKEEVLALIDERVAQEEIVQSYTLWESLTHSARIAAEVQERYPQGKLVFRSWLNRDFLTSPMASTPQLSGVRNAILGSLWMIAITMLIAFPVGVGAAIYLEEYASASWWNRLIETNINNLAGVPSIIYGLLGLAIFVRALEHYTSGAFLGITDTNGRTILSAALTMALLILPLIIINAREALRAVPNSLRQASYGLGATKWQTVWHHVLPSALPGILTGTILGMSRALGETAPLIVVGASTFIVTDPTGPFSKFTALPIQIYNWTQQPSEEFRAVAAAAIIVLLAMLLTLNAAAVLLRNRFRRIY
ncbi:MAG TPA: phosphate ABC transporter permease PstA [Roseiflexaceae bacterium]|nr:phosphate ABC transporter permease PstA [Roseiflexaceae bacterium]